VSQQFAPQTPPFSSIRNTTTSIYFHPKKHWSDFASYHFKCVFSLLVKPLWCMLYFGFQKLTLGTHFSYIWNIPEFKNCYSFVHAAQDSKHRSEHINLCSSNARWSGNSQPDQRLAESVTQTRTSVQALRDSSITICNIALYLTQNWNSESLKTANYNVHTDHSYYTLK